MLDAFLSPTVQTTAAAASATDAKQLLHIGLRQRTTGRGLQPADAVAVGHAIRQRGGFANTQQHSPTGGAAAKSKDDEDDEALKRLLL